MTSQSSKAVKIAVLTPMKSTLISYNVDVQVKKIGYSLDQKRSRQVIPRVYHKLFEFPEYWKYANLIAYNDFVHHRFPGTFVLGTGFPSFHVRPDVTQFVGWNVENYFSNHNCNFVHLKRTSPDADQVLIIQPNLCATLLGDPVWSQTDFKENSQLVFVYGFGSEEKFLEDVIRSLYCSKSHTEDNEVHSSFKMFVSPANYAKICGDYDDGETPFLVGNELFVQNINPCYYNADGAKVECSYIQDCVVRSDYYGPGNASIVYNCYYPECLESSLPLSSHFMRFDNGESISVYSSTLPILLLLETSTKDFRPTLYYDESIPKAIVGVSPLNSANLVGVLRSKQFPSPIDNNNNPTSYPTPPPKFLVQASPAYFRREIPSVYTEALGLEYTNLELNCYTINDFIRMRIMPGRLVLLEGAPIPESNMRQDWLATWKLTRSFNIGGFHFCEFSSKLHVDARALLFQLDARETFNSEAFWTMDDSMMTINKSMVFLYSSSNYGTAKVLEDLLDFIQSNIAANAHIENHDTKRPKLRECRKGIPIMVVKRSDSPLEEIDDENSGSVSYLKNHENKTTKCAATQECVIVVDQPTKGDDAIRYSASRNPTWLPGIGQYTAFYRITGVKLIDHYCNLMPEPPEILATTTNLGIGYPPNVKMRARPPAKAIQLGLVQYV